LRGWEEEALASARTAVGADPGAAAALLRLAQVHQARGETEEALAWAERALMRRPEDAEAEMLRAEALLLMERYAEGWAALRARFRLPGAQPFLASSLRQGRPLWEGEPLAGRRLLLVGDQGFGDVIQFSRYIPWAAAQGGAVRLAVSDPLVPLIRAMLPGLPLATRAEDYAEFDLCAPLSDLPRLHGTIRETIPQPLGVPVAPSHAAAWRQRLAAALPPGRARIGLVWAGRPTHGNDRNRSIPFAWLAGALADRPDLALVSLQLGARAEDPRGYAGAAPFYDASPHLTDYLETAAAIAALDAVVTVDTSVAHLAGTMGRATHLLLPFAPDWRWGRQGTASPWYPSLHLCRQQAPRDWSGALAAMIEGLSRAR